MIDRLQRRYAVAIANHPSMPELPDDVHDKAILYGRFGQLMSRVSMTKVADDMRYVSAPTISDIASTQKRILMAYCAGVLQTDAGLFGELEQLLFDRAVRTTHPIRYPRKRMEEGLDTNEDVSAIVLRSILARTDAGQPMPTKDGLYSSSHTSFRLAVRRTDEFGRWHDLLDQVDLDSGECGEILGESAATYSPNGGLQLAKGFDPTDPAKLRYDEPTIGCPATLLKGFIGQNFNMAVDAAIRSHIFVPADQ